MSTTYSLVTAPTSGTTSTGLNQLVDAIYADNSLAGNNAAADIAAGAAAANGLIGLIAEAATATGAGTDGLFTATEVVAMNGWIRANRLTQWTALHGDDATAAETGFHLVQNDGADTPYRGQNLVNTVMDGIFHMGFTIQNGAFLNEDGAANATVDQVAGWLTQFWTDRATTNTGLDRIVNLIQADAGLAAGPTQADIAAGQDAANGINQLIANGIAATGALADNWIDAADVTAINGWIRSDATRLNQFLVLHGDDETGSETGYHLVQNDGANTTMFGKNLVNAVADSIYHIGFQIQGANLLNEDGATNAAVADVASWINYFYTDQSTTGTGLDKIVDTIKSDAGLARNTTAADINAGANYANQLNQLLIQSITATNAMADGWITAEDLRAMNAWVNSDATRLAAYIALHGDDETTGEETGYHLVQNDGATTNYFGRNLINGVADSIYHFGFTIQGNNLLNEDGAVNASLSDVGNWVNYFYKGSTWINGDATAETITGGATGEEIVARGGADVVDGGAGDDLIWGGDGNDTLRGGAGADLLDAGGGSDLLDGGADADTYRVTGNAADPLGFHGYNTFADSGTSGRDRLLAFGSGNVDVGLQGWNGSIEEVDASGVTGQARLIADNNPNLLDFRTTTLIGNLVIDGSYGSDTIYGSTGADSIIGGAVEDFIDGGEGGDTYLVYGNETLGWAGWSACDTYTDTGTSGTDVLKAVGPGDVDIGLTGWGARTGIELLDITGAAGRVRLVGNSAGNTIDLRNTALVGSGVVLDAGAGYDTVYATTGNDTLIAGTGNDLLAGGAGNDVYQVSGNQAAGLGVFNGIDTYQDSAGQDTLVASGVGDVDIGLTGWTATTGIETLNASGVTGTTRLLGDDYANTFDLRSTQLLGSGFVLDGGRGNDTIWGTAAAETIVGGGGDDVVDGGAGDDTYRVNGVAAGGWDSFHGYDSYSDAAGNDRLIAVGTGDVDIGMKSWGTTGIETIDTTGAAGTTRLLGDGGNNLLDFRSTTLLGSRIVLDAGGGHDVLYGTAAADTIDGGTGNDTLYGGTGNDTYRVSRGSATDRISDDSGSLDQMVFGTGVSADQLWFRHVGNDLEVRIIGTVDIVSISNWYLGSANHVEQFRTADGRVLLDTQVDNLVSAMAGFSPPGWAVTTLPANYQTTLLPVINGNWA